MILSPVLMLSEFFAIQRCNYSISSLVQLALEEKTTKENCLENCQCPNHPNGAWDKRDICFTSKKTCFYFFPPTPQSLTSYPILFILAPGIN